MVSFIVYLIEVECCSDQTMMHTQGISVWIELFWMAVVYKHNPNTLQSKWLQLWLTLSQPQTTDVNESMSVINLISVGHVFQS